MTTSTITEMARVAIMESSRRVQFESYLTRELTPGLAGAILRQLKCTETDTATVGDLPRERKAATTTASSYRKDNASDAQARYAADLLRTRLAADERVVATVKTAAEVLAEYDTTHVMSKALARNVIDSYAHRSRIVQVAPVAAPVAAQPAKAAQAPVAAPLVPGIYQVGDDVYKVQESRQTHRLYAQKLVDGRFDYDAGWGAMKFLRAEHLMTTEQAKAFGMRFGMCVNGHPLSDRTSRYFGYGECCANKNGWLYDKKLVPADFE